MEYILGSGQTYSPENYGCFIKYTKNNRCRL